MYEDLTGSKFICLDTETKDTNLLKMGTGVFRSTPRDFRNDEGYLLGVSIVNDKGVKGYYNLGHYDCTEETRQHNIRYLKEVLALPCLKIGQNIQYDLDWIENWLGIPVNGDLYDIGIAEALLDEHQGHYSMEFMGTKYKVGHKAVDKTQAFCDDNNLKGDPRKWLWKMPYYMVEEYALQDVDLPVLIWRIQVKLLIEQNLMDLCNLECELIRVLLMMRRNGVKLDKQKRENASLTIKNRVSSLSSSLIADVGHKFNYNSSKHLAFVFDEFDIPYNMTKKNNPSITRHDLERLKKGFLVDYDGNYIKDDMRMSIGDRLAEVRRAAKVLSTFIDGSYVKFLCRNDLIHCSFYNTKTEHEGTLSGTVSGRFSCADPNLQQIPSKSRDPFYGGLAREVFVPDPGCWWCKTDYAQIEYRFMAHFAVGPGAADVRATYAENPYTDYHQYIVDLTGLERSFAKNLNFGVAYGMGPKHMAEYFQWPLDYCYDMTNIYHKNAPYIKATSEKVGETAKRRGYIRTFLNRRSRLEEPKKAYKMFCLLMQGSAADLMKKAMYESYKAGVYDVMKLHLTVHDETDKSVPKTKEGIEAAYEEKHIMETCLKLRVPVIADLEMGDDWSNVHEVTKEDLMKEIA